jgi:hypothetical protein
MNQLTDRLPVMTSLQWQLHLDRCAAQLAKRVAFCGRVWYVVG